MTNMENSVIEMTYYNSTDTFSVLEREWDKEFDNLIYYCASKDGKIIENIYIFPSEEIIKRRIISIVKSYSYGWYEDYRVKDRKTLKKINDIWRQILTVRR